MPRAAERVRWVGQAVVEPGRFHIDRSGDVPQQLVLIAEAVDERHRRMSERLKMAPMVGENAE
jgi:hypothetical protein